MAMVFSSFDNQFSAEHAHRAAETEFPGLLGRQLDWHGYAGGKLGALLEIRENHLVGAGRGLLAAEIQPHRTAAAHDDRIGRIAALHQDHRLLVAAAHLAGAHAACALEPEEPGEEDD